MSQPQTKVASAPDAALRAALQQALERHFGGPRPIARLERRPSAYRTSHALEEMTVGLTDGTRLEIMFKDLSRRALPPHVRQAKPPFLYNPEREIETYRGLLGPARLGTATCFGAVADRRRGRYWLFLEKVPGREMYQVGDFALWKQAARWLAGMHGHFAARKDLHTRAEAARLLRLDRDYYRRWMRRAGAFAPAAAGPRRKAVRARLAWLADRYDNVVDRLSALPGTLLHGEFYVSNVLVQEAGAAVRVCPVDWEMAALGPGLIDLAALTAGRWTDGQKAALACEYYAARAGDGAPLETFWEALACCRLHLAVQWLGWSRAWSAPPEHAWDWLEEAMGLAEKLAL
jgi:aminoglycoside phosphotransferase (APT) family kinase protein